MGNCHKIPEVAEEKILSPPPPPPLYSDKVDGVSVGQLRQRSLDLEFERLKKIVRENFTEQNVRDRLIKNPSLASFWIPGKYNYRIPQELIDRWNDGPNFPKLEMRSFERKNDNGNFSMYKSLHAILDDGFFF